MPTSWRRRALSTLLPFMIVGALTHLALSANVTEDLAALFEGAVRDLHVEADSGWMRLYQGAEAGGSQVTVRTQVQLHNVNSQTIRSVYLAGLGPETLEGPLPVVLEWAPSGAATWFGPRWSLRLRSDEGLLVRDDQLMNEITLGHAPPVAGHTYQTYFSYHAGAALLSFSVVDLTSGQTVYVGEAQLASSPERYRPLAGVHVTGMPASGAPDADDAWEQALADLVSFDEVAYAAVYTPVGSRWTVGSVREDGSVLPVQRFGADEQISLLLPGSVEPGGRFEVYLAGEAGADTLLAQNAGADETVEKVSASDLAWGMSQLHLRYVSPTAEVWLTDSVTLTVGSAVAVVTPLEVDAHAGVLHGAVKFITDADRLDADVSLDAVFTRLDWNRDLRRYNEVKSLRIPVLDGTFNLSEAGWEIPFRIPFPEPEHPAMWRVTLQPQVSIAESLPLEIADTSERLFTTYPAAQSLERLPFTLVVLPDTQNYPKAYPDILTRQAEWIAANAKALNIGAVLHVGDIVDNNDVTQWQRAATSLHVLDGVVPYVLAVGNHDVRVSFTSERSLFDREGALLNQYFTVDNAKAHSNLGGTFTPGRLENSYSLFEFGGAKYLALALEWGPRDDVLAWADEVLTAHADHKVIIITHAFTAPDGGWVTQDRYPVALPAPGDFVPEPSTVNSAADIWERLIHRHANVFMVLSGHMGFHGNAYNARLGAQGNRVYEIGTNYQNDPNGGNGWLLLMTFTPDEQILVEAFSPYLCEHRFDFGWFYHSFWFDLETGISRPLSPGRDACAAPMDVTDSPSSVTVQAEWQFSAAETIPRDERLWIAFGADTLNEADLSVVWWLDTSTFFPVGRVSLIGKSELLPKVGRRIEQEDGTARLDLATIAAPAPGHTYQLVVSHAPDLGALGVHVVDVGEGHEMVSVMIEGVAIDLELAPPRAGGGGGGEAAATSVATLPQFTPIGLRWMVQQVQPDGSATYWTGSNQTLEAGDVLHLELTSPVKLSGSWQVSLASEDGVVPLAQVQADAGTVKLPILTATDDLVGLYDLIVEYVEDGRVLWTDSTQLRSGRVIARLQQPSVFDQTVIVPIMVESTFPVTFELTVDPSLFHFVWDPSELRYIELPVEIDTVPLTVSVDLSEQNQALVTLEVPAPDRPGTFRLRTEMTHNIEPEIQFIGMDQEVFNMGNPTAEFKVVTYNIWATEQWPRREAAFRAVIADMQPDILALQELRPQTLMVLDEILPGHERVRDLFRGWVYEGNIYWSAERFDLVTYGAEDIGIFEPSRRLFWVRLREKATERTVLVATAHYTWDGHERMRDVQGNPRTEMAARTVQVLEELALPEEPIIFMGDLNEAGEAIDVLRRGGLRDSVGSFGEPLAYTHPADPSMGTWRLILDWQLHQGPIRVVASEVVDFIYEGIAPSDHKPVAVTYALD